MTEASVARQAAEFLYRAHRERDVFARLPAHISPATIEQAYDMQDAFNALIAPERGPLAGYKIALTTPVMQRMVGFDSPCAGAVFQQGVHHSPAEVNGDDYVRLGAECEIAVRLARDLPASGAPYDRAKASEAVGALMAAFELVDDRGADYSNLYFLDVVADNTWNAGVVLGPETTDWTALDLGDAQGEMTINGATAGTGSRARRPGPSPGCPGLAGQHPGQPREGIVRRNDRHDRQHRQHQVSQPRGYCSVQFSGSR